MRKSIDVEKLEGVSGALDQTFFEPSVYKSINKTHTSNPQTVPSSFFPREAGWMTAHVVVDTSILLKE
jgi:hypothetical protein